MKFLNLSFLSILFVAISSFSLNISAQTDDSSYFSLSSPGVAKDNRTGLEWMRCSLGQKWSEKGKTCTGLADMRTLVDDLEYQEKGFDISKFNAKGFAGKKDWRLPTIRELASIRYCSTGYNNEQTGPYIPFVAKSDGKPMFDTSCNITSQSPSINLTIFPNTDGSSSFRSSYWSSTKSHIGLHDRLVISFYGNPRSNNEPGQVIGYATERENSYLRPNSMAIRLVRNPD